jgi:hypothetical protein
MLCAHYCDGRWHWLAVHQDRDGGELAVVERRGAYPGDPDGEVIAFADHVRSEEVPERAAEWLSRGWAISTGDRVARRRAVLAPASGQVAPDPGDRPLAPVEARAVVAAAVDGQAGPFCLFPNPAAHRP